MWCQAKGAGTVIYFIDKLGLVWRMVGGGFAFITLCDADTIYLECIKIARPSWGDACLEARGRIMNLYEVVKGRFGANAK